MNRKIIIGGIIVLLIFTIFTFGNRDKDSEKIKIGAVLSLTGMAAADGENMKAGIEFAKMSLAKEGINLEVVYEDDETESAKTVSAVNKVTDIDGVSAIIGPTWSFLSASAASTIQNKEIVSFNPANTSEHVEGQSDYFLFGAPKNSLKEEKATEWLEKTDAKRVAIVVDDGAWGESHLKPFENAIKNTNGILVTTERLPFGVTGSDIQTIIAKLVSLNVDAVLYTGFDQSTAMFINKKDSLGAEFSVLAATEIVRKQNKERVVQIDKDDNIYLLVPETSEEFVEEFTKEYGYTPGPYADRAYDGTILIAKAMLEKPENTSLNEYIRQMNYEGYMGIYSFDENNDLAGGKWVVEQIF